MHKIELPEIIGDLESAGAAADCYEPSGGAFKLTARARDEIAACNADLAERDAEHDQQVAERDARLALLDGALSGHNQRRAIRAALTANGVNAKLAPAAEAYLLKSWSVVVDDNGAARAVSGDISQPLNHAIENFLANEGAPFAARQPMAATSGQHQFAAQLRKLIGGK